MLSTYVDGIGEYISLSAPSKDWSWVNPEGALLIRHPLSTTASVVAGGFNQCY